VFPYDDRLKLLSAHLQQLVMESLGKSVRLDGTPVGEATVPVWWGGRGNRRPAQLLPGAAPGHRHRAGRLRRASCARTTRIAKTTVRCSPTCSRRPRPLRTGRATTTRIAAYAGNRPSTVLLLDALTPRSLGALIALYEHSVYLQSAAWGINAFDQFGVELGKQLANGLMPALRGQSAEITDP
jgi:glucose-6-phosphate isomerase